MAGFYGKMPSKGDFVHRGTDRDALQKLDDWFQQGLNFSKETLGDGWLERYQVAPIWRYYLSPGVVDENAWTGVWIASIDKVNRNFPLTILDADNNSVERMVDLLGYQDWYLDVEDLLLSVLEEGFDFDAFCSSVEALAPPVPGVWQPHVDDLSSRVNGLQMPDDLHGLLYEMAEKIRTLEEKVGIAKAATTEVGTAPMTLMQNLAGAVDCYGTPLSSVPNHCVWLSEGSENIGEQVVISNDLPAAEDFTNFLTGF